MMSSLDDQHAVHARVELRRAALRGAVEVVAAWVVDLERHRKRSADHCAVDEHVVIDAVDRKAVARAETVVRCRVVDRHDLAALHVDLRGLVFPRMLTEMDDTARPGDALHAPGELPLLVPRSMLRE